MRTLAGTLWSHRKSVRESMKPKSKVNFWLRDFLRRNELQVFRTVHDLPREHQEAKHRNAQIVSLTEIGNGLDSVNGVHNTRHTQGRPRPTKRGQNLQA